MLALSIHALQHGRTHENCNHRPARLFIFSLHAAQYQADEVANGFQVPWGIEFIDSQRVVVNEKNGTISLLNVMTGQRQKIHSAQNVNTSGQAGLLDVALAPNTDKKIHSCISPTANEPRKETPSHLPPQR